MKTIKITLLAFAAVGLVMPVFNGCKKGEEDPAMSLRSRKGRVAGEWTVTAYESTSDWATTYSDPNTSTGDLVKSEGTSSETFDGTNVSESNTGKNTYDDGKTTSNSATASGSTITWSYTGTSGTTTSTTGSYSNTVTKTYTFEKDGTFTLSSTSNKKVEETDDTNSAYKLVETETDDETVTAEGTWSFIGKDKTNEYKNKERIGIWYSTYNDNTVTENKDTYTDKNPNDFFDYSTMSSSNKSTDDDKKTVKDTNPDEIWEIVQLKNKEMKVIIIGTTTTNGTSTSSNTSGSTTTSSTSTTSTTTNWNMNATLTAK